MPGSAGASLRQQFNREEVARVKSVEESPEHKRAKHLIAEALRERMRRSLGMPWFFKDTDASEFHLAGNLLLGAAEVVEERTVKTSFGCAYRLDVGIVSKTIDKAGLLLGGVEIEWEHPFDGRKALIGKSQAFPLISIDISGLKLEDLTLEWADRALTSTTQSSDAGRRSTYIYLHDLLYPQYLQVPQDVVKETRHQFVVFAPDEHLQKLQRLVPKYRAALQVPEKSVAVSLVNAKSDSSKVVLANLGDIVGPDWQEINPNRCLMVTFDRPTPFDEKCVAAVREGAKLYGYDHMEIVSGAGHDAVYMAKVAPTGMIFVPCEGGISHNEIENADPKDLEAGGNVLLHAMLERAQG